MRWLDHSFAEPAENLALEEILLEEVVAGRCEGVLRLWESSSLFVVLGTAQRLADEVFEAHCASDGVAIMRRCSAGGCVLQGPGSLNYTLVRSTETCPELRGIRESYCYITACLRSAFAGAGFDVHHSGTSDITLDGKKISGNAQRRRRHGVLHHGTLVYQPNYPGMARYLKEPAERPGYRGARTHAGFVGRLPLEAPAIKALVCTAFGADGPPDALSPEEQGATVRLAREKYATEAWIRRR